MAASPNSDAARSAAWADQTCRSFWNLSLWQIVLLLGFAFAAGLIDAIAGGGGLLQLPLLLVEFPHGGTGPPLGINKAVSAWATARRPLCTGFGTLIVRSTFSAVNAGATAQQWMRAHARCL